MKTSSQRGMALLIVLITIATLAALVAINQQIWLQSFQRHRTSQFLLQARWQLLGAESIILSRLRRGDETLPSPGQTRTLQLDERTVSWTLSDRSHCFNVNALITDSKKSPGAAQEETWPQRVFRYLLQLNGATPDQIDLLLAAINPPAPRYSRLYDITQLRPLLDRALWLRLAPLLCALPDNQLRINLNALSEAQSSLLSALLLGALSPAQAGALLHNRPPQGWQRPGQLDALWPAEDNVQAALKQARNAFTLESPYLVLRLWLDDEDRQFQLRSLITRDQQHFLITERHYGLSDPMRQ